MKNCESAAFSMKNFMIFYVVIKEDGKDIMEVRRFLYAKRNWKGIL